MYNLITLSILGDDGKDDALNVEDDAEHAADNSIKLTGKKAWLLPELNVTAFAWLNNVTGKAHRLPKALIIGCKKSGTGWLIVHFHILEQSMFTTVK